MADSSYDADTDEESIADSNYQTDIVNCICGFNEEENLIIQVSRLSAGHLYRMFCHSILVFIFFRNLTLNRIQYVLVGQEMLLSNLYQKYLFGKNETRIVFQCCYFIKV